VQFKKEFLYLLIGTGVILGVTEINNSSGQTPDVGNLSDSLDILYLQRMYESPQTIVLRGEGPNFEPLGKAIDQAKLDGFVIDSVTVFTETSQAYGNTRLLTDIYTVFMSKK
jgi:hypothetical protein